jgi:hypothetical protein
MLSLIRKALRAAQLFDTVLSRLERIETEIVRTNLELRRFDKIAKENDALWQMLDDQPLPPGSPLCSVEEANMQIAELLLRNAKVQGDA